MTSSKRFFIGGTGIVAVALAAVVSFPAWRTQVQSHFTPVGNEVLATAEGDLLSDGSLTKVIKYRSEVGIYIEVLKVDEKGATSLLERILLPDKHDGQFNYHGHITRLAIGDIDNTGQAQLLVPTFDNQLVPHLNVFRYNPATRRFDRNPSPK